MSKIYKACSHDIAVDDLNHCQSAIIAHRIKGLGLDIGVLEGAPPQILLRELSKTSSFSLLSDGLDGFGTVDRFLRAGNTGQTVGISTFDFVLAERGKRGEHTST